MSEMFTYVSQETAEKIAFGLAVRTAREAKRESQDTCAEAIGIGIRTLQRIESGDTSPQLTIGAALARHLSLSLDISASVEDSATSVTDALIDGFSVIAHLFESGHSIPQCLQLTLPTITNETAFRVVEKMHTPVQNGLSLSEAMATQPTVFTPDICGLINVAEMSGELVWGFNRVMKRFKERAGFEHDSARVPCAPS